jgi:hypothetical protein
MAEYDFQTLSSFDFQVLSRDLLQKKLGVVLESFERCEEFRQHALQWDGEISDSSRDEEDNDDERWGRPD